jgi:hypothetical protein
MCLQNNGIHNLVVLRIFGILIWENLCHFDVIFDAIYNLYIIGKYDDFFVTSHANMCLVNSFIHHFHFTLIVFFLGLCKFISLWVQLRKFVLISSWSFHISFLCES